LFGQSVRRSGNIPSDPSTATWLSKTVKGVRGAASPVVIAAAAETLEKVTTIHASSPCRSCSSEGRAGTASLVKTL
jgi:hypothetical protein